MEKDLGKWDQIAEILLFCVVLTAVGRRPIKKNGGEIVKRVQFKSASEYNQIHKVPL